MSYEICGAAHRATALHGAQWQGDGSVGEPWHCRRQVESGVCGLGQLLRTAGELPGAVPAQPGEQPRLRAPGHRAVRHHHDRAAPPVQHHYAVGGGHAGARGARVHAARRAARAGPHYSLAHAAAGSSLCFRSAADDIARVPLGHADERRPQPVDDAPAVLPARAARGRGPLLPRRGALHALRRARRLRYFHATRARLRRRPRGQAGWEREVAVGRASPRRHLGADRYAARLVDYQQTAGFDAPRSRPRGHVRPRSRPPLRCLLLPPGPGRRAADSTAASGARAPAAHLHPPHTSHPSPSPPERRSPHPETLQGDLRMTSAHWTQTLLRAARTTTYGPLNIIETTNVNHVVQWNIIYVGI